MALRVQNTIAKVMANRTIANPTSSTVYVGGLVACRHEESYNPGVLGWGVALLVALGSAGELDVVEAGLVFERDATSCALAEP